MIDSRAIIDPSALIAEDVEIGPWTLIGPDVEIASGTKIDSHVVIKGPTKIGKGNRIFQFSSIGEDCQDLKYNGEPTELVIGDRNTIREFVTIHRGTIQDQGITKVGHDNLIMAYTHIAHDCVLGNSIIISNSTALAGHVKVGDFAVLAGATKVHQFCQIGAYSMCAADSLVLKDVPAFVMASGRSASPHGINSEGLRRKGFDSEVINEIKRAYKLLYRQGLSLEDAIQEISIKVENCPPLSVLLESLHSSERGIIR